MIPTSLAFNMPPDKLEKRIFQLFLQSFVRTGRFSCGSVFSEISFNGRLQLIVVLESDLSKALLQSTKEKVVANGQIGTIGMVADWDESAFLCYNG